MKIEFVNGNAVFSITEGIYGVSASVPMETYMNYVSGSNLSIYNRENPLDITSHIENLLEKELEELKNNKK
jgi:hypothetical protein